MCNHFTLRELLGVPRGCSRTGKVVSHRAHKVRIPCTVLMWPLASYLNHSPRFWNGCRQISRVVCSCATLLIRSICRLHLWWWPASTNARKCPWTLYCPFGHDECAGRYLLWFDPCSECVLAFSQVQLPLKWDPPPIFVSCSNYLSASPPVLML